MEFMYLPFEVNQYFGNLSSNEEFWKEILMTSKYVRGKKNKSNISPKAGSSWKSIFKKFRFSSGFDVLPIVDIETLESQKLCEKAFYHIKTILVGSSCVGKTTLKDQFVKEREDLTPFVERFSIDISCRLVRDLFDNSIYNIEIWDPMGMVSGNIQLDSQTKRFYNRAHSVILIFDMTLPESWYQLKNMYSQLQEILGDRKKTVHYLVLGNKIDLRDIVAVDPEEVQKWCDLRNLEFFEVSGRKSINVFSSLLRISRLSLEDAKFEQILNPELRRKFRKPKIQKKKNKEPNICIIS